MCGIIGVVGASDALPILLEGLERLEYRGYDSAGVALLTPDGVALRRSAGKLINLENAIRAEPLDGDAVAGVEVELVLLAARAGRQVAPEAEVAVAAARAITWVSCRSRARRLAREGGPGILAQVDACHEVMRMVGPGGTIGPRADA